MVQGGAAQLRGAGGGRGRGVEGAADGAEGEERGGRRGWWDGAGVGGVLQARALGHSLSREWVGNI